MVEFLTLFLGLVSGPQEVALRVASEQVRSVTIQLDGSPVTELDSTPWVFRVDLGPSPRPRELVAVARSFDGTEIGRARQVLNRPRPPAEVGLLIERGAGGQPVAALVNWQNAEGLDPITVDLRLDGEALVVVDPERTALPPTDPDTAHVLEAVLRFPGEVEITRSVTFGGPGAGDFVADLTAVPVLLPRAGTRARPAEVASWLDVGGRSPRVVAVERGVADVVLVRGAGAQDAVAALGRGGSDGVGSAATGGAGGLLSVSQLGVGAVATDNERLRRTLTLAEDRVLRLLVPHAARRADRRLELQVFPVSPPLHAADGGLLWALTREVTLPGTSPETRFADAVAIAGLRAAAADRRRAVVLVLAGDPVDASRHSPAQVRELLGALGVPLLAWRLGAPVPDDPWQPLAVATLADLRRAVRDLETLLDRQRIVWLEGRHAVPMLTAAARSAGVESL